MKKKLVALLLTVGVLGLAAGCSNEEENENTENTAQETEEESVVN